MWLRSLLAGCWGSHDLIRDRRDGRYGHVCMRCQQYFEMLTTPTIQGPCHQASEVMGKPKTKTIRLATKPTAGVTTFRGRR